LRFRHLLRSIVIDIAVKSLHQMII